MDDQIRDRLRQLLENLAEQERKALSPKAQIDEIRNQIWLEEMLYFADLKIGDVVISAFPYYRQPNPERPGIIVKILENDDYKIDNDRIIPLNCWVRTVDPSDGEPVIWRMNTRWLTKFEIEPTV